LNLQSPDCGDTIHNIYAVILLKNFLPFPLFNLFIALSSNMLIFQMVFQEKVLQPLGAITSGSQFLEPDGNVDVRNFLWLLICKFFM
jgi:hypothetical protein